MKKILSILLSAVMMSAMALTASANTEAEPSIVVDGREISFREDQPPVIQNDRLYVPVRRILEAMGTDVDWNGKDKTVTVSSSDNITQIILEIDNPEVTVYTYTSVFDADEKIITSDVAPVIMNDRTMLPIRVIAENLGATVKWDEETMLTTITTQQAKLVALNRGAENTDDEDFSYTEFFKDTVPNLYITCDDKDIKKDDKVVIKLHLKDIEKYAEDARLTSTTLGIHYDQEAFRYEGYQCHANGEDIADYLGTANDNFYKNCLKLISLNLPENAYLPGEDGVVMHITFIALKDGGGSFSISDAITEIGYDTQLLFVTGEEDINSVMDPKHIYIDINPIEVK